MKTTAESLLMPTRRIRGAQSSSDSDLRLRPRRYSEWVEYQSPPYPDENDTRDRIEVNSPGGELRSGNRRGHG